MNSVGKATFRISAASFGIALIALILLSLTSLAHIARAQGQPAEELIYNFAPATGSEPLGLARDGTGNLYAATGSGGADRSRSLGCGSILKLTIPGSATTLYTFTYSGFDNLGPNPSGLLRDTQGSLYTATTYGGRYHLYGSVFKLKPSGSEGIVYSFQGGLDGSNPYGGLAADSAGELYGTTRQGGGTGCGGQGCGVVYKLTRSGSETVLYRFTGGADGRAPVASPILDAAGNLYGTASLGGTSPALRGRARVAGQFGGWTPWVTSPFFMLSQEARTGHFPEAGLTIDPSNNLYGDASQAGESSCLFGFGCGVVFKIDSAGNFTVLHTFVGGPDDGASPMATLTRDPQGNLYGTTALGGGQACNDGCGVVFKLDPANNETILHAFTGGATDGATPQSAPLIRDGEGNLYGITGAGGVANSGVIFQVQIQ